MVKDDPRYTTFFTMLRLRVPASAIKQKMMYVYLQIVLSVIFSTTLELFFRDVILSFFVCRMEGINPDILE